MYRMDKIIDSCFGDYREQAQLHAKHYLLTVLYYKNQPLSDYVILFR
jgi:hypothetical protein